MSNAARICKVPSGGAIRRIGCSNPSSATAPARRWAEGLSARSACWCSRSPRSGCCCSAPPGCSIPSRCSSVCPVLVSDNAPPLLTDDYPVSYGRVPSVTLMWVDPHGIHTGQSSGSHREVCLKPVGRPFHWAMECPRSIYPVVTVLEESKMRTSLRKAPERQSPSVRLAVNRNPAPS